MEIHKKKARSCSTLNEFHTKQFLYKSMNQIHLQIFLLKWFEKISLDSKGMMPVYRG